MSAGLSEHFREPAAPTEVGECRWCQTNVFSDQPRLSRGSNVWHRNCAVNEAHWLRTQLDGTTTKREHDDD